MTTQPTANGQQTGQDISPEVLQDTLALSKKEAMASSAMTATCDNFLNAFAIYLRATSLQLGWLTAIPQLTGAFMQLVSIWLDTYCPRKGFILFCAYAQATVLALMTVVAIWHGNTAINWLIFLVVVYHALTNLIQPQWRAWMGSIVPQKERGVYFASRSRLTMAVSLGVFIGGGSLLSITDNQSITWLGFTLMFAIAFGGRMLSGRLLARMHDPSPNPTAEPDAFFATLREVRLAMHDTTFRSYSLFVAGMQGAVAISAPFFAVYMLTELEFTYLEFSINSIASIATQFLMLSRWGRFSDQHGNRLMMLGCSVIIPILPLLWMVMPNFYYLLIVQVVSGIAWSGFNLSTANYLYDIRPHHTNFATYAAVQSGICAVFVFCGAVAGGVLASVAPSIRDGLALPLGSALFLVFLISAVVRIGVLLWFIPHAEEPTIRTRPQLLRIIFRVARINTVSGVVLDWLTVTQKPVSSLDTSKPAEDKGEIIVSEADKEADETDAATRD